MMDREARPARGGRRLARWIISLALVPLWPAVAAAESRSPGCGAASIDRGGRLERSLDVGGTPRSYILDVPDSIEPQHPVPLLLDYHGFGHSAEGVWKVSG